MRLKDALEDIAVAYDLDTKELRVYASEDQIGGYHSNADESLWDIGSIWGAEGQILYALVRAIKPKQVVNLGVWHGCSLAHIAAALATNADEGFSGSVIGVDKSISSDRLKIRDELMPFIKLVEADAVAYTQNLSSKKVDLIFEDLDHGVESITAVWKTAQEKLKKGGFIVSHDAMHFVVGADVRFGILASGVLDAQLMLVEPSDCGLAVWRKS